jgi:multidrug efflux pump subunit AcrB
VVVNDSIVMVDFINQCLAKGMSVNHALMTAGSRRLRAVFLTSVTTVAGLAPMLLEKSFQAQVLIPMATSLAFGLMGSTALVLLVVPLLYRLYAALTFTEAQMAGHGLADESEARVGSTMVPPSSAAAPLAPRTA